MNETRETSPTAPFTTRVGTVPSDGYGEARIYWLVSKQTNGARELTMAHTTLPVGGSNPLHRHPNCEEALYVLDGTIEHVIDGSPNLPMTTGDTILIPRGVWHQAINRGETPAVLLVAFSSAERESEVFPG